MVVELLILPVGFGRFLPRWQMVQEEDLRSRVDARNDPRRRPRRETWHASTVNPSCVNVSETDLRMRQVH
jgi:hypothetical protein